jgi:diguanylate cyclase (GGDEF)-like protein
MDILSLKQDSTKSLIFRVVAINASVLILILLGLYILPFEINKYSELVLGGSILIALITAAIYVWIIKPLLNNRDNALQALDDAHVQIGLMAFIDPLTQLANRRQLLINLERITSSCIRHKIYGALLLIDLNNIKEVNDLHGHDAGDAVLVEMAKRLDLSTRFEDVLGRLVGDKFVVLIDHLDVDRKIAIDKSLVVADKLIKAVNAPFEYNGFTLQVGASVGVSLIEFEHLGADAIIRKANVALYRVKKSGEQRAIFSD